jgi:hypothetical protein
MLGERPECREHAGGTPGKQGDSVTVRDTTGKAHAHFAPSASGPGLNHRSCGQFGTGLFFVPSFPPGRRVVAFRLSPIVPSSHKRLGGSFQQYTLEEDLLSHGIPLI